MEKIDINIDLPGNCRLPKDMWGQLDVLSTEVLPPINKDKVRIDNAYVRHPNRLRLHARREAATSIEEIRQLVQSIAPGDTIFVSDRKAA